MRRVFDRVHSAARRQVPGRHVLPCPAVVARDVHRSVVRAGPEHVRIEPRRAHRIERRVHFFACHVARDRLARRHLPLGSVRGDVGAEARPVQAAVDRLMHVLRTVVDDLRVVRIDFNRRLTHEPVLHVLRVLAVPLLRINPVVLLLSGLDVVAAELALAVAVDDLAVGDHANLAALAARRLNPRLRRIVDGPRERRHVVHGHRGVVLLRADEPVREFVVDVDHVELGGGLIEDRRPALRAVLRHIRAAVARLDQDLRVVRIDPDDVVVAVRRGDGRPRLAAVGRMVQPELRHPHVVLVFRIDEHFVEVKRPRAQRLRVALQRPRQATVGRTIQPALRALRFHLHVDDLRIRLRDVHPYLSDQIVGQAVAHVRPVIAAVGCLVHAAFAGRAAADDRPGLALRSPRARINLVRIRPVDRDRDRARLIVD